MSYDKLLDELILSLVQTEEIAEQSDLQDLLKEREYAVPQATLSRRLKKLKIAKVAGIYRLVDFLQQAVPLVLHVQVAESGFIVMHTHPGSANNLGIFFDKKYVAFSPYSINDSGILGTVAGDDTLLVVVKSKAHIAGVLKIIQTEFPYLKIPKD